MKNFIQVLVAVAFMSTMSSCLFKKEEDPGSGSGVTVEEDLSGSGGVSATPTPHGMYCSTYNGWDNIETAPIFSNTTLSGFVNSVTLRLSMRGSPTIFSNTPQSRSLSLKIYTCGSNSSKGSLQTTITKTVGLYSADQDVTFTASSPIAIPTTSGCGTAYPIVFEFVGAAAASGYYIGAQSTVATNCAVPFSSSTTAVVPGVRGYNVVVSTSP